MTSLGSTWKLIRSCGWSSVGGEINLCIMGQHDTYTDHNRYAWPARHDKGPRQNGPKIHIIPTPESGRADTQSQDVNQA
jgi:hypothetical protein